MSQENEHAKQSTPRHESSPQNVLSNCDEELDVQMLEERIAPGIWFNRNEVMSGERSLPHDVELDVLLLEERITPGIWVNRNETIVEERPSKNSRPEHPNAMRTRVTGAYAESP